jgi:hypothetical protein
MASQLAGPAQDLVWSVNPSQQAIDRKDVGVHLQRLPSNGVKAARWDAAGLVDRRKAERGAILKVTVKSVSKLVQDDEVPSEAVQPSSVCRANGATWRRARIALALRAVKKQIVRPRVKIVNDDLAGLLG